MNNNNTFDRSVPEMLDKIPLWLGWSLTDVARTLLVTPEIIKEWKTQYIKPSLRQGKDIEREYGKARLNRASVLITDLEKLGCSCKQIAGELAVDPSSVSRWKNKTGDGNTLTEEHFAGLEKLHENRHYAALRKVLDFLHPKFQFECAHKVGPRSGSDSSVISRAHDSTRTLPITTGPGGPGLVAIIVVWDAPIDAKDLGYYLHTTLGKTPVLSIITNASVSPALKKRGLITELLHVTEKVYPGIDPSKSKKRTPPTNDSQNIL